MLDYLIREAALRHMFGGAGRGGGFGNRYGRHAVGGYFANYLNDWQFNFLLSLLIMSVALNIIARSMNNSTFQYYFNNDGNNFNANMFRNTGISFYFAPITSLCTIFLIYLHYEETIRGTTILKNWNQKYSFHPGKILYNKEYYRLITGQLLHTNKFHLYMNVSSLAYMGYEEFLRQSMYNIPMMGYLMYFSILIISCGIVHVYLVATWLKYDEEIWKFSVGFSGVIFALKTLQNYDQIYSMSNISIPIMNDYFPIYIPLEIPTFTYHWFELFIISIIFPNVCFYGHLAGILTGYIFAFFWNIKWLLTVLITFKIPEKNTYNTNDNYYYPPNKLNNNNKLNIEQQQQAQIQQLVYYDYNSICKQDFGNAFNFEHDETVTTLCRRLHNALQTARNHRAGTHTTPVFRFSQCMQNPLAYFSSGASIYSDDYYYDDEYYDEEKEENINKRNYFSFLNSGSNNKKVKSNVEYSNFHPFEINKAKQEVIERSKFCTIFSLYEHCEFREFTTQEILRANFTRDDRLERIAKTEDKCKEEAKLILKKMIIKTEKNNNNNQNDENSVAMQDNDNDNTTDYNDLVEEKEKKKTSMSAITATTTTSSSSSLQDIIKMKRNQQSAEQQQKHTLFNKCIAELKEIDQKELITQRIYSPKQVKNNNYINRNSKVVTDQDAIKFACARKISFLGCLGINDDENAINELYTSIDSQKLVSACLVESFAPDITAFQQIDDDNLSSLSETIKGDYSNPSSTISNVNNNVSNGSYWKDSTLSYLKENGLTLIITLAALFFIRRFIGIAPPTSSQPAMDETENKYEDENRPVVDENKNIDNNKVTNNGNNTPNKEVLSSDGVSTTIEGNRDNDVIRDQAKVHDGVSNENMHTNDDEDDNYDDEESREEFYKALADLTTKNADYSQVAKALKVMETIIVNAITKGQSSNDPDAAKYRRIKTTNPTIKKYYKLKGAQDLMIAVGFTLSRIGEDGQLYLVYPLLDSQVPKWIDVAIEEMREKACSITSSNEFPGLSTTKSDTNDDEDEKLSAGEKEVKQKAAAAALERFEADKKKKQEAKDRTETRKFTAGMGGGEARSIFYRGGT